MSGSSKKKSGGKKTGPIKGGTNSSVRENTLSKNGNEAKSVWNPLIRPSADRTINQRSILTGFYQKNGKRVQHTVHDGALQMPNDALDVVETVTATLVDAAVLQSKPKYNLPGLDSVVRPCLDSKLETMIVTELLMEKVQIPQEQPVASNNFASVTGVHGGDVIQQQLGPPTVKMIKTSRPMAKNRRIRRIKRKSEITAERIRGGGEIPNIEGQQQKPGTVARMDIDQVTIASVDLQNDVQLHQSSTGQTLSVSATQPSDPGNMNMIPFQSNRAQKTSTADISADNEISLIRAKAESDSKNTEKDPNTSGTRLLKTGNTVTSSSSKSLGTDVEISAYPYTNNTMGKTDIQKDLSKPPNQAQGSTIPLPVNTPETVSQLVSNESSREAKITASVKNQDTTLQQTLSSETSASPNTALLEKVGTSRGESTKLQGNDVSKTQTTIQSLQNIIKPSQTATKPVAFEASTTGLSDSPSGAVTTNPMVTHTASSTAHSIIDSSTINTAASSKSSEPMTVRNDALPTTYAVPVVTSSIKAAGVAPGHVEQKKKLTVELPEAKVLTSKPAPQWEHYKPGQNDETITSENQLPPKPYWYKKDSINDIERTMLPEWFDESSSHRTSESYVATREKIIEMSEALNNRNVTNTMIRRSVLGDAGSLQRLRSFLVNWGIINRDGINDSAPTTASLRPDLKKVTKFTNSMRDSLMLAVTKQATKKRKLSSSAPSSSSFKSFSLDWEEIARQVGYGLSAESCLNNFMILSLEKESSCGVDYAEDSSILLDRVTPEGMKSNQQLGISQEDSIKNLVSNSNPEVLRKILDAAIDATNHNPLETRAAMFLGVQLTQAVDNARGHEVDLALKLSKLLEARMQKLENRMAMMDDVEGILEAEKVALEMERRDLYTARCRHWFGGI